MRLGRVSLVLGSSRKSARCSNLMQRLRHQHTNTRAAEAASCRRSRKLIKGRNQNQSPFLSTHTHTQKETLTLNSETGHTCVWTKQSVRCRVFRLKIIIYIALTSHQLMSVVECSFVLVRLAVVSDLWSNQGSALVGARCAEKAVVCKVCVQKMSSGSGACGGHISGSTSNDTQSWQKAKKC